MAKRKIFYIPDKKEAEIEKILEECNGSISSYICEAIIDKHNNRNGINKEDLKEVLKEILLEENVSISVANAKETNIEKIEENSSTSKKNEPEKENKKHTEDQDERKALIKASMTGWFD